MKKKKTIVLTGGTGFLGSHLTSGLIENGYSVISLVRPSSALRYGRIASSSVSIVQTLLDRSGDVRNAIKKADLVVYCAGSVRGRCDQDFEEANLTGLENIVRAVKDEMVTPKIILISSLAARCGDLSPYAKSKLLGEGVVKNNLGVQWVIVRPTAIYGPRDKQLLPLLQAVRAGLGLTLGPRGQKLSFIHVEDCVAAVIATIKHFEICRGSTFEIHDGKEEGYTWEEIRQSLRNKRPWLLVSIPRFFLEVIAKINMFGASIFGYAPMLTSGKVNEIWHPSWACDNKEMTAYTGWVPTKRLREGVEESS